MEIFTDLRDINKKSITQKNIKFYYFFEKSDLSDVLNELQSIDLSNKEELVKFVKKQDGFFKFGIWNKNFFFGAVDQLASKSILYKIQNKKLFIYFNPPLKEKIETQALVDIFYSGYTLKDKTIFGGIKILMPGEYLYLNNKSNNYLIAKWNMFNPKYLSKINESKNFEKLLVNTFSKIKNNYKDKKYLVALSAGVDSRLIVSLMKELEMDFETFTYGFTNQRDFKITEKICKKLDVKNHKIIMDSAKAKIYNSNNFEKFLRFNNFGISANNFGDYGPLSFLENKINKTEFVIINGQAGDFLTGAHLPIDIISSKYSLQKNKSLLFKFILDKHYGLWDSINKDIKESYLNRVDEYYFKKVKNYLDLLKAYEIYEFENRQSKWVTGQQKVYDFFGYAWDLPLWKISFMSFFLNKISLREKINQSYYKKFLIKKNYYGIWKNVQINPKLSFPISIKLIRLFFKSIFFFISKKKWHQFQKKYLEYFYDPTGVSKLIRYDLYIRLTSTPRNSISIITKKYLERYKKK